MSFKFRLIFHQFVRCLEPTLLLMAVYWWCVHWCHRRLAPVELVEHFIHSEAKSHQSGRCWCPPGPLSPLSGEREALQPGLRSRRPCTSSWGSNAHSLLNWDPSPFRSKQSCEIDFCSCMIWLIIFNDRNVFGNTDMWFLPVPLICLLFNRNKCKVTLTF